ncbi:hypothetical protein EC843_10616 [Buttiauxella sp. JUb87]|uniref:hypothetical protein n=1 Tax=Buttiauxella sp. JUb87 TaxID=2485129 RepID=UPI00105CDF73|nr:hypothetical protein [Buttiauxella sp. JUb87]TDN50099.1 hypothetical protein EC843_10616 [Buttiauxella sp. JUb87]
MYVLVVFYLLLISSFMANAGVEKTIGTSVEEKSLTWNHYVVSDLITPKGEFVAKENVSNVFNGKVINIDNKNISIPGLCKFEYKMKATTPLNYWHSQKTVDLYSQLLSEYNIMLEDNVSLFTPVKQSNNCDYPFNYFIKVNGSLIFVLNNRMIIYSQDGNEERIDNASSYTNVTSTLNNEYGSVDEVFYRGGSLLDAYHKYRDGLTENNKKHLMKNISPTKDFTMKCNEGCIEVNYKWNGPDNLKVKQGFNGGETEIFFSKETQGTKVITKSSPD